MIEVSNQNINDIKNRKLIIALNILKIIVVLIIAGVITYLTYQFQYFEHIEAGVKYGIWHGFPLSFYFKGYHVIWGDGVGQSIADWQQIERWNYINLVLDYIIYVIFIGGVLLLVERGLKKLLKIEW